MTTSNVDESAVGASNARSSFGAAAHNETEKLQVTEARNFNKRTDAINS